MINTRQAAKWILRNTKISNESLTPSIKLHLITEACPLWMSTPEQCPFPDPYWAFYWPGGQALTKFILENASVVKGCHVLDWGCGCGASSIASTISGAQTVLSNDIDQAALLATLLNYRLNKVETTRSHFDSQNFVKDAGIETLKSFFKKPDKSVVLLGDMFYDSDFANTAFKWLKKLQHSTGVRIFVGDPDRHPLAEKKYLEKYETKFKKKVLVEYSLPGYVTREHYGFASAKVLELEF